jgi:hypothetical protein
MTRVQILEKKVEVLVSEKQSIASQRYACRERFEKALTRGFNRYFRGIVSEDIRIECTQTGIYFKKMNEEGSYEKELFSIYLKETYFSIEKREEMFRGCELSYYTTSSNSDWELERLTNLGRVAQVLKDFKDEVVNQANELAKIYNAEMEIEKFYERESLVEKQISEIRSQIKAFEKERIVFDLKNEGITFDVGCNIQLKWNYAPRIVSLKLIDFSKSGKKATAIFEWERGRESREENVNVDSIIGQVLGFAKNITQSVLAE